MKAPFEQFRVLTFDCYGTLIDWESGLLGALRPVLAAHNLHCEDAVILKTYGELEAAAEAGDFKPYREILRTVVRGFGERFGFNASEEEQNALPDSLGNWRPFPDTVAALKKLKQHFRLCVISNVDDDLFAATAKHLEVPFDEVITALQCKSYKPALNNFRTALHRLGIPEAQQLHCAESLYHDVAPCRQLGIKSVWVDRRKSEDATTATVGAQVAPDWKVKSLAQLVELIGI